MNGAGIPSVFDDADLLADILRRLDNKSLMRFKSVCKSWRNLITSRYFCLLWRQHHHDRGGRGILLTSQIDKRKHLFVHMSGGHPQLEIPRQIHERVLCSRDGFLLNVKYEHDPSYRAFKSSYWISNPATMEIVQLPKRLIDCKLHVMNRDCDCRIKRPTLASAGEAFALAWTREGLGAFRYQIFVNEKRQAGWRSTGKLFTSECRLHRGVQWRKFVVWVSESATWLYDFVEGEVVLAGASPPGTIVNAADYQLGESGGNLHFIGVEGSRRDRIVIYEMEQDLSGWMVKHSILMSELKESIGWKPRFRCEGLKIGCLIEDEDEDSTLVLGCGKDVVLYRIQTGESSKLCEWEFIDKNNQGSSSHYFPKFAHYHALNLSPYSDTCK